MANDESIHCCKHIVIYSVTYYLPFLQHTRSVTFYTDYCQYYLSVFKIFNIIIHKRPSRR